MPDGVRSHGGLAGRARSVARPVVRTVRKRAKRAFSRIVVSELRLRNRFSSARVTGSDDVVVSLTTYGPRLQTVHLTLESIARGQVRPSRIILWLDDQRAYDSRPEGLRRLERRGVEVKMSENLGPHTKYFPYVRSEPDLDRPLVTADDDILYPRRWLRTLLEAHRARPTEVHCYRASRVIVADGKIQPYASWPWCKDTTASVTHFATGVSGVIYPPHLQRDLAERGTAFTEVCPAADDIWLHWVALRSGTPISQVGRTPVHFPVIRGTQDTGLVVSNVHGGGNDTWVQALYEPSDVAALQAAGPSATS